MLEPKREPFSKAEDITVSEIKSLISTYIPHMAEQYMRHDYRSMWDIWQGVCNELELINIGNNINVKSTNCITCTMLKDGVKFRKTPIHTCGL